MFHNIFVRSGLKIDIIKIRPHNENITNQFHACSRHDSRCPRTLKYNEILMRICVVSD